MNNKKIILIILGIICILFLTGFVTYQFLSQKNFINDDYSNNGQDEKNNDISLIEEKLDQFAQYGSQGNVSGIKSVISNEMQADMSELSESDIQEYFSQFFSGYKKVVIHDYEIGSYVPVDLKSQYGIRGEIIYANDSSNQFEAVLIRTGDEFKIFGFSGNREAEEYLDEKNLSADEEEIVKKIDEDAEAIKIILNQFVQYGLEKRYDDAINLTSGPFEQILEQQDDEMIEVFFSELASEFEEFVFGIETKSYSEDQTVKYMIYGDIMYKKEKQGFEAIVSEEDSGFKIYEIAVSEPEMKSGM